MELKITIDGATHNLVVPEKIRLGAHDFFAKMDKDMGQGWQMGAEWVESPDVIQRCQIAANKILSAAATGNEVLMQMMAAYILNHMPKIIEIDIDTGGEMQNTEFREREAESMSALAPTNTPTTTDESHTALAKGSLPKLEALAQAGRDVGKVYRAGRAYRFTVYDEDTEHYIESPPFERLEEAERLRNQAFQSRFHYLAGEDEEGSASD